MKKYEDLLTMNLQFFAEDGDGGEGENVTEAAEQSDAEVSEGGENDGDTGVSDEGEAAAPQPQSDEANRAFANMRREMEAAKRQAAEIDAIYAKQFGNYTNPETGQPIRSARDYAEAMAAQQRMQARQQLQENNIDPNLIDNMIANSPVVRQAEAAMAELNNTRAQQQIERDIEEVLRLDPSINSKDELMADPSFDQVLQKVQSGMNLVDAYKIVNFDRLSNSKTAAARQAAINQVKGQSHLANGNGITTPDSGEDIPASMIEDFKDMFPDKSMKELKALYNRTLQSRR
jgi:hypothetical protein